MERLFQQKQMDIRMYGYLSGILYTSNILNDKNSNLIPHSLMIFNVLSNYVYGNSDNYFKNITQHEKRI